MARKKLGEILIEAGVLDETKLRAALGEQQRWGGPLGRILIEMKFITEEALVKALSEQLHFPAIKLQDCEFSPAALDRIPADVCEQYTLIPFSLDGKFLDVAMADPTNLAIVDELRIRTRLNVRAYLAGPRTIERYIALHYHGREQPDDNFGHEVAMPPPVAEFGQRERSMTRKIRDPFLGLGPEAADPLRAAATAELGAAAAAASRQEVTELRARVEQLEALLARDEDVLRKLMSLLIEKGLCTRDEILEQLK